MSQTTEENIAKLPKKHRQSGLAKLPTISLPYDADGIKKNCPGDSFALTNPDDSHRRDRCPSMK